MQNKAKKKRKKTKQILYTISEAKIQADSFLFGNGNAGFDLFRL